MMQNGRLYQRQRMVPRTLENVSSWWPTPRANDPEKRGDFDAHNRRNGLPAAVKRTPRHFPTPTAADGERSSEEYLGGNPTLLGSARRWPTPAAQDGKNSTLPPSQRDRDTLPGEVIRRVWPTPQARDATPRGAQGRRFLDPERSNDLPDAVDHKMEDTGQLNPRWVAWLMGFPAGWTALEDSETP